MSLTIPDTPTARAAADLVREAAPAFLLNHSYRTYLFGTRLVATDVDDEAAFVAAMIHDLGLTDRHRGAEEFGPVGAELAGRFLARRGWQLDRIGLVEQAILRHTDLVAHDDPTARVVQVGAQIDVIGYGAERIDGDTLAAILTAYPRLDFVTSMRTLYLEEISLHPQGAFAELESTLQLSTRFTDNSIDAVLA
jgi:HD superfamily phosphodiesterase